MFHMEKNTEEAIHKKVTYFTTGHWSSAYDTPMKSIIIKVTCHFHGSASLRLKQHELTQLTFAAVTDSEQTCFKSLDMYYRVLEIY